MQDAYIFNRDVNLNVLYPDGQTDNESYERVIIFNLKVFGIFCTNMNQLQTFYFFANIWNCRQKLWLFWFKFNKSFNCNYALNPHRRKINEEAQHNLDTMLSGGEKKRIGISRALIRKADIYVFDEPTISFKFLNLFSDFNTAATWSTIKTFGFFLASKLSFIISNSTISSRKIW